MLVVFVLQLKSKKSCSHIISFCLWKQNTVLWQGVKCCFLRRKKEEKGIIKRMEDFMKYEAFAKNFFYCHSGVPHNDVRKDKHQSTVYSRENGSKTGIRRKPCIVMFSNRVDSYSVSRFLQIFVFHYYFNQDGFEV